VGTTLVPTQPAGGSGRCCRNHGFDSRPLPPGREATLVALQSAVTPILTLCTHHRRIFVLDPEENRVPKQPSPEAHTNGWCNQPQARFKTNCGEQGIFLSHQLGQPELQHSVLDAMT